MSRVVYRVLGWIERLQFPTVEARVRSIVRENWRPWRKVLDARFGAVVLK